MKQKITILISLAGIIVLFVFFLSDILIPLLRMEFNNDVDGAQALLASKGALGGITVILVEALQMVVVFIPAEFIQISSGLSYPFPVALALCDLGVCLGATLIFILVRVFRFDADAAGKSKKNADSIQRLSDRTRRYANSTQLLMYLLFIMPVVPFGAICYYGSSTRIRYPRYIFTAATGAIPSIIVSNLIGTSARAFIMHALPLRYLILIIVLLAAALFAALWLILTRVFFKGSEGTPDSPLYDVIFRIVRIWRWPWQTLHVSREKLQGLEPPFMVLCNHTSFYDFYYMIRLLDNYRPAYVINQHILSAPVLRHFSNRVGMIPKKLFSNDTTAFKIIRTLRAGYPVVIFPEGRLSVDGRNNPIIENPALLAKQMKVDLVIAKTSGAYFAGPKWRKSFYRSHVTISVENVFRAEELADLSRSDLQRLVEDAFVYDESADNRSTFPQKRRAEGLDKILYRCADCGTLYTTRTKGADLFCASCGSIHHLDETYHFTDRIGTISAYYDKIKEMERACLDEISLTTPVLVKVFVPDSIRPLREEGVCTLTKEAFHYRSETTDTDFSIPMEQLPALAFSCDEEFELYQGDHQYYFYPKENRRQVTRWALIVDLFRQERTEGKDQDADT